MKTIHLFLILTLFSFNLCSQDKETFKKTLDDKRKVVFEERVISKNKTREQLSIELGVPQTNLARWESDIRADYENYLKTGQVKNKYLLIDQEVINSFAEKMLNTAEEKYLLEFRIASTEPKSMQELSQILQMPTTTLSRREAAVKEKLDQYLVKEQAVTNEEKLDAVLNSTELGEEDFDTLFKSDLLNYFLDKYKKDSSTLNALRLLIIEKIRQLYISYANTPESPDIAVEELTLRYEIIKMEYKEDIRYKNVKELKTVIKAIDVNELKALNIEYEEAKRLAGTNKESLWEIKVK
jgi:hypothetical protein